MSLVECFTSRNGNTIRAMMHDGEMLFCGIDVCRAMCIANPRNKFTKLDDDEKLSISQVSGGQRRRLVYVTEPGLYKILLTCRDATNPGTPAHAFCRWVTHDILPMVRRQNAEEIKRMVTAQKNKEKSRRLWVVVKNMNTWNHNARKKYFGAMCNACANLCYQDRFNSPHVRLQNLEECKQRIKQTMARCVRDAVPKNQSKMTDFFRSS